MAARCVALERYQSVVVDPWELDVGNSVGNYQTISIALTEGQKWIDEYLAERNGI